MPIAKWAEGKRLVDTLRSEIRTWPGADADWVRDALAQASDLARELDHRRAPSGDRIDQTVDAHRRSEAMTTLTDALASIRLGLVTRWAVTSVSHFEPSPDLRSLPDLAIRCRALRSGAIDVHSAAGGPELDALPLEAGDSPDFNNLTKAVELLDAPNGIHTMLQDICTAARRDVHALDFFCHKAEKDLDRFLVIGAGNDWERVYRTAVSAATTQARTHRGQLRSNLMSVYTDLSVWHQYTSWQPPMPSLPPVPEIPADFPRSPAEHRLHQTATALELDNAIAASLLDESGNRDELLHSLPAHLRSSGPAMVSAHQIEAEVVSEERLATALAATDKHLFLTAYALTCIPMTLGLFAFISTVEPTEMVLLVQMFFVAGVFSMMVAVPPAVVGGVLLTHVRLQRPLWIQPLIKAARLATWVVLPLWILSCVSVPLGTNS